MVQHGRGVSVKGQDLVPYCYLWLVGVNPWPQMQVFDALDMVISGNWR